METLREALDKFIGRNPAVKKKIKGYEAITLWPELIDVDGKSWVFDFTAGSLEVMTENTSFAQELTFGKRKILKILNDRIGSVAVKDIKIRIGTRPKEK